VADANVGAASAVASQQQPGAVPPVTAQAGDSGKVDLTQFPQFRDWQREMDRKLQEASAAQRELQSQLASLQQQRERDELADIRSLDPEERAAKLEQRLVDIQQQARQREIVAEAAQAVQNAGVSFDDPRLAQAKSLGPTDKGLAAIYRAVTQILAEEKVKAESNAAAALELERARAAQAAQVAAVRGGQADAVASGMLTTSSAAPVVQPVDGQAEAVTALRQRYAKLRGTGADYNNPSMRKLIADARSVGLTLGDLA
jgi:hypothetical protein